MIRRSFVATSALAGLAGLAACATGASGATTLAAIQSEAAAVNAGIQASDALFQASAGASPAQKALAAQSAQALAAAETQIAAIPATGTATVYLQTFLGAAQAMLPVLAPILSINPPTEAALLLGLGLISAFVGAVPATATLATTTAPTVGAAPGHVAPPVPVPLPTRSI